MDLLPDLGNLPSWLAFTTLITFASVGIARIMPGLIREWRGLKAQNDSTAEHVRDWAEKLENRRKQEVIDALKRAEKWYDELTSTREALQVCTQRTSALEYELSQVRAQLLSQSKRP